MCLGVPGRILEQHETKGVKMATVDFGGITKEICLAFAPDALIGEYVIVHAGFAINRLDEAAALETLRLLAEIDAIEDEVGPRVDAGRPPWEMP